MNSIEVTNLSKRYGFQWIIKDFSAVFNQGMIIGIAGKNGSGKSTLIRILAGYLSPSRGTISYDIEGKNVKRGQIYNHLALAAPYTDVINEFTLYELFQFHQKFKSFSNSFTFESFEEEIQLTGQKNKLLQQFSSGMKQKIQLALSIFSNTHILLLDEPTAFLDENAKKWFKNTLLKNSPERIVIIASNDQYDLDLCSEVIIINDEKY